MSDTFPNCCILLWVIDFESRQRFVQAHIARCAQFKLSLLKYGFWSDAGVLWTYSLKVKVKGAMPQLGRRRGAHLPLNIQSGSLKHSANVTVTDLKHGRAVGPDGIGAEQYSHPLLCVLLSFLIRLMLKYAYVPDAFGVGMIIPLIKGVELSLIHI